MELREDAIERYSRQLIVNGWGGKAQRRLQTCSAVLPSNFPAAAYYLAAAGIGRLILEDVNGGAVPLRAELLPLNPAVKIEILPSGSASEAADIIVSNVGLTAAAQLPQSTRLYIHLSSSGRALVLQTPPNEARELPLPDTQFLSPELTTGTLIAGAILEFIRTASE